MFYAATKRTLAADSRGAILVPAIVMGALLVGALFYVAAAGDAIIFRTQLQDAADASAFSNAVWHARGMNVVAVINMLMSLLLAIIVLFHVIEVICLLAAVFPPLAPAALNVVRALVQAENRVANVVNGGLDVLQVTQRAVVVVMPYVGSFQGSRVPSAAQSTLSASAALLPTVFDKTVMRARYQRLPGNDLVPAALPAEADDFGALCGKATLVIPKQVEALIERVVSPLPPLIEDAAESALLTPWRTISAQVESFAASGDGILCQPVDAILSKLMGEVVDEVTAEACGNEVDTNDQTAEQAEKDAAAAKGQPAPVKPQPTESEKRDAANKKKKAVDGCSGDMVANAGKGTELSAVPARMWAPAANGNVFTHIWSRANAQPRLFANDRRLMAVASHGTQPTITPSTQALAEAEFYFDCEDKWGSCKGDALWAPGWTARMRRFRMPTQELGKILHDTAYNLASVFQEAAFDGARSLLASAMGKSKVPGGDFLAEAVSTLVIDNVQRIPAVNKLFESANEAIGQAIDASGLGELLDPREDDTKQQRRIH